MSPLYRVLAAVNPCGTDLLHLQTFYTNAYFTWTWLMFTSGNWSYHGTFPVVHCNPVECRFFFNFSHKQNSYTSWPTWNTASLCSITRIFISDTQYIHTITAFPTPFKSESYTLTISQNPAVLKVNCDCHPKRSKRDSCSNPIACFSIFRREEIT